MTTGNLLAAKPARLLALFWSLAICCTPAVAAELSPQALVERFAALALQCADQEYPNLIHHTMVSDDDVAAPRKLTPSFYGCYDWHSAVHGHWLLLRAVRMHPEASFVEEARALLEKNLSADRLLVEASYLARSDRTSFERPYGLAWLLQLVAELDEWDDPQAQQWRQSLRPLEQIAAQRLSEWIPKLHYPIRVGEHSQTAFAFGLIWDYAQRVDNQALLAIIADAAARFYDEDRACPLNYEPSGQDFLSPCLAEADLQRRIQEPAQFAVWLSEFLPDLTAANALPVGVVTDRSDGKLAHIDGLNLSRAWMLEGIAAGLPDADPRRPGLVTMANEHTAAGLAGVSGEHYAGGHWLGSFALYLQSKRGIGERTASEP